MPDYADYAWLISDAAAKWLAVAAADARPEHQLLASLRKDLSAERARLVVEQAALRRRAREKFGDSASRMFFSPVHLEQATDLGIARCKAVRFADAGPAHVADYCCGIGGDLIALAERGEATGWDLSPVTCLLAEANVRAVAASNRSVRIECGDVTESTPDAAGAWHLDPDRRASGRRSTDVFQLSPGADLIDRWLKAAPNGAVKLAPATTAPDVWADQAELEWITSGRECRQQVAWFGAFATAPGLRRATVVARGEDTVAGTLVGAADRPCRSAAAPSSFVYDPDAAVLAAGLLGELAEQRGLQTLGAGSAYLTGDHRANDQLLAGFAVQDCLPFRPAAIASYLEARHIGRVEIKKRGVEISPEALRKRMRLRGDVAATVILTRIGQKVVAIIAERVEP